MIRSAIAVSTVVTSLLIPGSLAPGPARIQIQTRAIHTSKDGPVTSRLFEILNRPAYRNKIGVSTLTCRAIGAYKDCRQVFRLQRGQIVSEGIVQSFAFYRLAVTGGTGYYDTVGGSTIVQEITPNVQTVVIELQGFS